MWNSIRSKILENRYFLAVQRFLDADGNTPDETKMPLLFGVILTGWVVLWTLWPSLCIGNVSIDVAENVAWGSHFQFGYDKNPYFGAWLSAWILRVIPTEYVSYLLSQLSIVIAMLSIWALAKRIFHSNFKAFLSTVSLLMIPFFSQSACEFNDDVIEIGLWAALAFFFYRGVRNQTWRDWAAAGFLAGLALMTKYLAGVLFIPLGLLLLITPEGRRSWKTPGLYLAMLIFLLLILPNLLWLIQNDFIAFRYALERADLTDAPVPWIDHLRCPWKMLGEFLVRLLTPVLAVFLLFRRDPEESLPRFERIFLWMVMGLPLALSLLFSIVTGGSVLTSWLTPYYVFTGIFSVMAFRPVPGRFRFRLFLTVFGIFTVAIFLVFGFEFLYKRPYLKRGCVYNAYPGAEAGRIVTEQWRQKYGRPLRYVVGPRTEACYTTFYSPDHPDSLFEGDARLSPWINDGDLRKEGALLIWEGDDPTGFFRQYQQRYPMIRQEKITLRRAVKPWFERLAGPSKPVYIWTAHVPPEEKK